MPSDWVTSWRTCDAGRIVYAGQGRLCLAVKFKTHGEPSGQRTSPARKTLPQRRFILKIVREETLVSVGDFAKSAIWRAIRANLYDAIRRVEWPLGSGTFTIFPEKKLMA